MVYQLSDSGETGCVRAATKGGTMVKDDYQVELRQEFIDTTTDELNVLDRLVKDTASGAADVTQSLADLRRIAHSIKGRGGMFDMPMLTVLAHRLEDYVMGLTALEKDVLPDVQIFVDRLHDALEGRLGDSGEDTAFVVRQLPAKRGAFDPDQVTKADIEVMLVSPPGAATQFVERELQACGYRVTGVASTFSALELIVRTQPDLVVASAVLPDLTGVDLAIALSTMPTTAKVPTALLTSYDRDHVSLRGLPDRVPVVRKGAQFGDDLADALQALKIT